MPTAFPTLTLSRGADSIYLNAVNGWHVLPGVEGLDSPPVSLLTDDPATWDGSLFRDARYLAREVFVPLHLDAVDGDTMRTKIKSLAALTAPKRGAVTLTVEHPDGTRRFIDGYLSTTLGTSLQRAEAFTWRRLGVALRCPDPFFYSTSSTSTFTVSATTQQFLSNTFLPVLLSNSQVAGTISITNDGDADAYPVWTIEGPASGIEVTVGTHTWTVPDGISADETLVVDTRRGQQSVKVNGDLAWGRLGPGADLYAFEPGTSTVDLDITGATSATTVSVTWTKRWLTAW